MTIDHAVFRFAGIMTIASLALGLYVHQGFFLLTLFVGLNLIQSSFTGFCPAAIAFKKLGMKPGAAFR
jgi:hypothetical protein